VPVYEVEATLTLRFAASGLPEAKARTNRLHGFVAALAGPLTGCEMVVGPMPRPLSVDQGWGEAAEASVRSTAGVAGGAPSRAAAPSGSLPGATPCTPGARTGSPQKRSGRVTGESSTPRRALAAAAQPSCA
jgi:hypothetical protein